MNRRRAADVWAESSAIGGGVTRRRPPASAIAPLLRERRRPAALDDDDDDAPLLEVRTSALKPSRSEPTLEDVDAPPPPPQTMPCRERTAEFRTAAKSMQMRQHALANGDAPARQSQQRRLLAESARFNQLAKRIGRDLSQTCAKLEQLSVLAKRKSLFDDRVAEVEQLTQIIKQDITGLNGQISVLLDFATQRAQTGGGGAAGGKSQSENHSKSVVVGLQSRLASVSTTFKQVLEMRTENLKLLKSRRGEFSQSQPIPAGLPASASSGNLGSVLLSDEAAAGGAVALDMDRLQQQTQLIDEQDAYLHARSSAMETIESSISELGSIFRQLAHLVSEQGEMVQRIDANVEDTSLNVEAAHMELLKYFRGISRNRWLAIKVFGVLIAFFIIFVLFLT